MKEIIKAITNNNFFKWLTVLIIYVYTQIVYLTCKWQIIGHKEIEALIKSKTPIIVVAWHGRILLSPKFPLKPKKHYAIISTHKDGEYIARYMEYHNVNAVRGSSKRGALAAFREALKILKKGDLLVITPDGPRGPLMKIGGNLIELAKMTGAAIIPYSQSTSRGIFLKTWDRFLIPFPFSKGVCVYGEPIFIDKDLSKEAILDSKLDLEKKLIDISKLSDDLVGRESIV